MMNQATLIPKLGTMYEEYLKMSRDVSEFKLKIIELESNLMLEKFKQSSTEKKSQRCIQDLEHYKLKDVIKKPRYEIIEDNATEVDFKNIYNYNKDVIKTSHEFANKDNSIEKEKKEILRKCEDLELEVKKLKDYNEILLANNNDLKIFVKESKDELLELNVLKTRIKELEDLVKEGNANAPIALNITKMKDMELKCYNLEKANKKLKDNHANLMLLEEENSSLSQQNDKLKIKLKRYKTLEVIDRNQLPSSNNVDASLERQIRHVERENEILKSQQAQISELNVDLTSQVTSLQKDNKSLKHIKDCHMLLLKEKQGREDCLKKEVDSLKKDCDIFKNLLEDLTEEVTLDEEAEEIICKLRSLSKSLEDHNLEIKERIAALDKLVETIEYDMFKINMTDDSTFIQGNERDKDTIVQLQREVERLNEELQAVSMQIIRDSVDEENVSRRDDEPSGSESYVAQSMINADESEKKLKYHKRFMKMSNDLLKAVKFLFGYTVEIGPNGVVAVHNCFSDDPTETLEFKIDEEVVLIDNAYSDEFFQEIDFNGLYPQLFARLMLDSVQDKENIML